MPPAPPPPATTSTMNTKANTAIERTSESCPCGQSAAKFCRDCALSYCEPCCAKRHAKGSFLRHTTVDVASAHSDELLTANVSPLDATSQAPSMCEECLVAQAALECRACELIFCASCSTQVHKIGTMQSHVENGSFAFFGSMNAAAELQQQQQQQQQQQSKPDNGSDVQSARASWEMPTKQTPDGNKHQQLAQDDRQPSLVALENSTSGINTSDTDGNGRNGRDVFGLKATAIRDGEATETPLVDPDQEIAPCSPALTKEHENADAADADAESYDLWSSWSVRSFSDRSSSIDSTSQWRNLRSLSIDSTTPSSSTAATATSGDDELPLTSISKSLQSLQTFASPPATDETKVVSKSSPQLFAQRQRSYSDYTSLRSHASSDLWQESVAGVAGVNANRSSSGESAGSSSAYRMPSPASTELWRAMKTNFPSRHLLVKSTTNGGSFDAADVQRINNNLNNFGSVARVRDEFACEGLLFFTYFELKCAIGAVKSWFSGNTSSSVPSSSPTTSFSPSQAAFPGSEVVHFCLPYELPDELNCATLLVRLNGSPASSTEMRQFCSRYGEVASVLQNDINSSKYILEYNDARDVPGAISGLSSSFHASGSSISAVRTSPPTLDMAKIRLFQEHLDSVVSTARMASLDLGGNVTRPTSFSSSTASLMTSSPTSTASSPLNPSPSFLEMPGSHEGGDSDSAQASGARATSPFDGGIYHMRSASSLSDDHQIWSGGSASTSSSVMRPRSSSSSLIGLGAVRGSAAVSASSAFTDRSEYSNPYSTAMAAAAASTGSGTLSPYMTSHLNQQNSGAAASGALFHQQHLQQRLMVASGASNKYGAPVRSGSDPSFRSSDSSFGSNPPGASGGSGYHHNNASGQQHTAAVIGRNDQGIGEFSLSIERVATGADKRTTLMIRNIPNKYTQQMLLAEINQRHRGNYDFFYLPIDFKNKCNMGYAFINFMEAESIIPFYKEFDSQKWTNFNSEKVCAISYARLQGKQAMITRFQNSSLLEKHESYRPLVFVSSGVNRGRPETFPAPKQPQHHHHKKQMMHSHHHHLTMGNMPDEFIGGNGGNGGGGNRMYMQNHHHHHQQQQQFQAMQQAHQYLAAQHSHAAAGLHGLALGPQGANLNLHMNFQGFPASAHHLQQQQQQHVPAYHHYQPQHHQERHVSAAKTMSLAFGGAVHHASTGFSS